MKKAQVALLAVWDDELDVGNNEPDVGNSEVASFGGCRGGDAWMSDPVIRLQLPVFLKGTRAQKHLIIILILSYSYSPN